MLAAAHLEEVFRERGAADFPAVSMAALRALGTPTAPSELFDAPRLPPAARLVRRIPGHLECADRAVLGGALGETDDGVDHRLEGGVARHDRGQHRVLGKLLGFRFDHQHRFAGAGDDEIEFGILHLVDGRIDLDLALE